MAYPRDKGTYILDTDASDYAFGAVLRQEQDGRENKKCFRNIYAPHGAKFRYIFSVEAKPVQSK